MKPIMLLLAVPVLVVVTSTFAADDYPELKPGLWSSNQIFTNGKIPPMGGKMCTNDEVFKTYQHLSKDPNRPCKATNQTHVGSTYTAETECNFGGKIKHSSTVMTATGDTAIHIDVKPDDGNGLVMDMKYLGSCPADMVPGDFIMNNGMKINVLTGANSQGPAH